MFEATLLALGSAVLHAGWNLLVKTSDERFLTAWGQFLVGGICFLPVLLLTGLPPGDAVPFLVASSLVHVVYVGALVRAYHHGDFSFAYPLARGGGALLAAIGGVAFLGDYLSVPAWLSIGIVVRLYPHASHRGGRVIGGTIRGAPTLRSKAQKSHSPPKKPVSTVIPPWNRRYHGFARRISTYHRLTASQ